MIQIVSTVIYCAVSYSLPSVFRSHVQKGRLDLAQVGYCFLCLSTRHRRYCFCSLFLVRDELYCCINAMVLCVVSFRSFIFDAAVLSSWYEGSSFHSVGSLAKKFCTFIFPFNARTSKSATVLCVTQLARPVADNVSGGLSRHFADSSHAAIWRYATICVLTSAPILSSKRQPNEESLESTKDVD